MGEGIDYDLVRDFSTVIGILAVAFLILRPIILEKVHESQERIKRLDGRKDAE